MRWAKESRGVRWVEGEGKGGGAYSGRGGGVGGGRGRGGGEGGTFWKMKGVDWVEGLGSS